MRWQDKQLLGYLSLVWLYPLLDLLLGSTNVINIREVRKLGKHRIHALFHAYMVRIPHHCNFIFNILIWYALLTFNYILIIFKKCSHPIRRKSFLHKDEGKLEVQKWYPRIWFPHFKFPFILMLFMQSVPCGPPFLVFPTDWHTFNYCCESWKP